MRRRLHQAVKLQDLRLQHPHLRTKGGETRPCNLRHALVASMVTIASRCSTHLRSSGATIPRARQVLLLISDAKGGLRFVAVGRIRSML